MPVLNVSAFSTGTVQIRPAHVRSNGTPLLWWLLTSRRWSAPRPINVYVITHSEGVVLVDTGQDRASVTDPDYFPRGIVGRLYARLARFSVGPEDTVTAGLAALGHSPDNVHTAVITHLHQDHIGGLRELRTARIVVSELEWAQLSSPLALLDGIMKDHIQLPGLNWSPLTPPRVADPTIFPFTHAVDLFEDGSLLVLPTPGHTPGSLSVLLRQPGMPPMLFVGDLTYDVDLLAAEKVPGVGKRQGLLESSRSVNALKLRFPDLLVLAAHDPAAATLLSAALAGSRQ